MHLLLKKIMIAARQINGQICGWEDKCPCVLPSALFICNSRRYLAVGIFLPKRDSELNELTQITTSLIRA